MNHSDFGLIVKALRKTSFDRQGNRWTRKNLSRAIHLTEDQLGRLERGDRKYLDNRTLILLADSFNLSDLERQEFFYASLGLNDEKLFGPEEPEAQLAHLLTVMENLQVPAFIKDVYADIVAANKGFFDLYQMTPAFIDQIGQQPAGANQIRLAYSSTFGLKAIIGPSWREASIMALLEFRRSTLRWRHTKYFQFLFKTLLKEKKFELDWYSSHRLVNYRDLTYESFKYRHPFFGPLSYMATETTVKTKQGDLTLIMYNPTTRPTISVFEELFNFKGDNVRRLAGWPEKQGL